MLHGDLLSLIYILTDITISSFKGSKARSKHLERWRSEGRGVMIIGYEMFRTLVTKKKLKETVRNRIFSTLLHPGKLLR